MTVAKLPIVRVAEIAFPTTRTTDCISFYKGLGLQYDERVDDSRIHFAEVGEQLFGFALKGRGFFTGRDDEMVYAPLHVAFEVESGKIHECIAFLKSRNIDCSPVVENSAGWHGAKESESVYFEDPAGNIMELWDPRK